MPKTINLKNQKFTEFLNVVAKLIIFNYEMNPILYLTYN